MIDFACKQFNIDEIVKCGLGLTRADFDVMNFFLDNFGEEFVSVSVAKRISLNLTTVQKAVKKLSEKGILKRTQTNLSGGGYYYGYRSNSKKEIRKVIKEVIHSWVEKVDDNIDRW